MHAFCLHCNRPLGANAVLETLPIGRRIAFDAAQGRLWVVCPHCAKWNLVPFDTRWESIEAAERLFRDTRTRFSTDNIGLARVAEGLELVRIGDALRPEFAAWRYGESYRRRRRNTFIAGGVGAGIVAAGLVGLGVAGASFGAFGYFAWQGVKHGWKHGVRRRARFRVADPERDGAMLQIKYDHTRAATLVWRGDDPVLEVPRPHSTGDDAQPLVWAGPEVRSVGRRVTGGLNQLLGSRKELSDATRLLADHSGDLRAWLRTRAESGDADYLAIPVKKRLAYWDRYDVPVLLPKLLPSTERLAVELWMNEDIERTWLEGELKLLEREWREAERLARISDELAFEAAGVADAGKGEG